MSNSLTRIQEMRNIIDALNRLSQIERERGMLANVDFIQDLTHAQVHVRMALLEVLSTTPDERRPVDPPVRVPHPAPRQVAHDLAAQARAQVLAATREYFSHTD